MDTLNSHIIKLNEISYGYPGRENTLDGLNFSFDQGDRVALVGLNGSGKTTLLSIIMGLIKPDRGKVYIFGESRSSEKEFRDVRPLLGFVFQDADDQLFCPTVGDDIAFGPLNLGYSDEEADRITMEVLEQLGLYGFAKRVTHDLSGGEKKLVALGTALALRPRMLILDEPTNFLDKKASERLLYLLDSLGLPFLIVSHDFKFLERTGCRYVLLKDGKTSPIEDLGELE
jgi:cobalt/nickel transport system ATP-binding protein